MAPFKRTTGLKDTFTVSLTSPEGTGEVEAQIDYDDQTPAESAPAQNDLAGTIEVVLVSGTVGAALMLSVMLFARRRRRIAVPVGPTQVA